MFHPASHTKKNIFLFQILFLVVLILSLALTNSPVKAKGLLGTDNSKFDSYVPQSESLSELTVAYQCQDNSQQIWIVSNANSFEIAYEWFLSTGENGSGVVQAQSSDSFLTANLDHTTTIRYSFPQKELCSDEKCGESEIIKHSVTANVCAINTQEPNSTNTPSEPKQEQASQNYMISVGIKQFHGDDTLSTTQNLEKLMLKGGNSSLKEVVHHQIMAWLNCFYKFNYNKKS